MLLLGLGSITLVFYAIVRALFLIWSFPSFQGLPAGDIALTFLYGLRFDLSAIAWLAIPAFLVQGLAWLMGRRWSAAVTALFLLFQWPFLAMNFVDVEYVQFTGRRFTLEQARVAGEVQGKFWATMLSMPGLFSVGICGLALFAAACLLWRKHFDREARPFGRAREVGILLALFLGIAILARGGIQKKPIGFAHAQVFANPSLNHLSLNSSFTFLQSIRRTPLPREHYMPTADMLASMNGRLPGESRIGSVRPAGKQNVVIIILESFSLEHMGKIHGDSGYTPFLDELAGKGLFFPNAFANARRSIEGIGAILGGVPALMSEPFISSQYATNEFFGIGSRLASQGYSSVFYHGGHNGTMYFDQFVRSAGIQRYYGANEYPNRADDDGTWGIWDEPFFLNMIHELKNQPEPFAAAVFSLSSHSPFVVPNQFRGKFPKGTSEIHEVIGYTDQALREFFDAASKEPWFERTLFVITADHTYKATRAAYLNDLGNYRIPVLFFHPKIAKWPDLDLHQPIQQIDLLPSILDFLNIDSQKENLLGRSVFREGSRYVVLSSDGYYWLVTKDHVLSMGPQGDMNLAILAPHLASEKPPEQESESDHATLLEDLKKKLLATRQYFSEGLWDNKLYFPSGR